MARKKDYISPRSFFILVLVVLGLIVGTYFFTHYMLTGSLAGWNVSKNTKLPGGAGDEHSWYFWRECNKNQAACERTFGIPQGRDIYYSVGRDGIKRQHFKVNGLGRNRICGASFTGCQ